MALESEIRLGIDASNLRIGGGITHLTELLRIAEPEEYGITSVIVWGNEHMLSAIEPRDWLIKKSEPLCNRSLFHRQYWQRFRISRHAEQEECDLLFVPGGSFTGTFRPFVTMCRNMLPFEWRETRRYGFSWLTLKNIMLRRYQLRTFKRADGLIFLTQYARDSVLRTIKNHNGKVEIIPHGIHERFSCLPRSQKQLEEYSDSDPIRILYVSKVDAYKHQWNVAEAVAGLRDSGLPAVLDLVGPPGRGTPRLERVLKCVDPDGTVIRSRGPVPYQDLPGLYKRADINVFASSCENMPNILLEGMASGLPIACSDRGPMPEVLGEAGVYFDPEKPDEIADALRSFIESPELRLIKAEAAYNKARQYTWKRCAAETFEFLMRIYRDYYKKV